MRFAVVGQGYFAQTAVLPAFEHARSCELVALFSDDQAKREKLRRKHHVAFALPYEEYDDFLRSGEVQAVYIAVPNHLHRDYTVRAARAGVHVLCEKPMAVTVEECEQMIEACDENRVKLMIAYRLHLEQANLAAIDGHPPGPAGRSPLLHLGVLVPAGRGQRPQPAHRARAAGRSTTSAPIASTPPATCSRPSPPR